MTVGKPQSEWQLFRYGARIIKVTHSFDTKPPTRHEVFGTVAERKGDDLVVRFDNKPDALIRWTGAHQSWMNGDLVLDNEYIAPGKFIRVDSNDGFNRAAIVAEPSGGVSFDVLAPDGSLLARINIHAYEKGGHNLDVCLFEGKRALTQVFKNGARERVEWTPAPCVVSVEVRDS